METKRETPGKPIKFGISLIRVMEMFPDEATAASTPAQRF